MWGTVENILILESLEQVIHQGGSIRCILKGEVTKWTRGRKIKSGGR